MDESGETIDINDKLPVKLARSLVIPWILILIVFFPAVDGRIPLNVNWLVHHFYPWRNHSQTIVQNPDIDDPVLQYYPLANRAAVSLRNGRLPLWNPETGCGTPQLADFISQPLDPLLIVSSMLTASPPIFWCLLLLLQQLLLSACVAGYLLSIRSCITGASIGASAVIFSAPVINWMQLRTFTGSIIALFAGLWAVEYFCNRLKLLVPATALALAYSVLAGHIQFTLYTWLIVLAYLLLRVSTRRGWFHALAISGAVLLSAVFLSAPIWIPQSELLLQAVRGEKGRYFHMYRFGAAQWLSLFNPDVIGHPADGNYFGRFIYFRSYTTLPILYFGALPITCLLISIRQIVARSRILMATATGILISLSFLGIQSVRVWIAQTIPGVFSMDPGRSAMMASILLAALSGYGFTLLTKNADLSSRSKRLTTFIPFAFLTAGLSLCSLVLFLFKDYLSKIVSDNSFLLHLLNIQTKHKYLILYFPITIMLMLFCLAAISLALCRMRTPIRRAGLIGVIFILGLDLIPRQVRFNSFVHPSIAALPEAYDRALTPDDPMYRSTGLDFHDSATSESSIFPPNTLLLQPGISDFRPYLSTPVGAQVQMINHVQTRTYWDRTVKPEVIPLLNIAAVNRVFAPPSSEFSGTLLDRLPGMDVFTNPNALPRLRITGGEILLSNRKWTETIWNELHQSPQRFVSTTFIESPDGSCIEPVSTFAHGDILETCWQDHIIHARVRSSAPGLIVLADTWYPGWLAEVEGISVPIYRANGLFRAVRTPMGESTIVFRYRPVSFILGAFLMLVCVAGMMIWLLVWK